MRYMVWLPDGYGDDRDEEWPLIVFLHGSGDPDYDFQWVLGVGLPAVLLLDEEPDDFDFVVLTPQARLLAVHHEAADHEVDECLTLFPGGRRQAGFGVGPLEEGEVHAYALRGEVHEASERSSVDWIYTGDYPGEPALKRARRIEQRDLEAREGHRYDGVGVLAERRDPGSGQVLDEHQKRQTTWGDVAVCESCKLEFIG